MWQTNLVIATSVGNLHRKEDDAQSPKAVSFGEKWIVSMLHAEARMGKCWTLQSQQCPGCLIPAKPKTGPGSCWCSWMRVKSERMNPKGSQRMVLENADSLWGQGWEHLQGVLVSETRGWSSSTDDSCKKKRGFSLKWVQVGVNVVQVYPLFHGRKRN